MWKLIELLKQLGVALEVIGHPQLDEHVVFVAGQFGFPLMGNVCALVAEVILCH